MAFEWLAQIFWGFFIGGVIVTVIMMVLAGGSVSHGTDSGTSTDASTDITTDANVDAAASVDGHDMGSSDSSSDFSSHDMGHGSAGHAGVHESTIGFQAHGVGDTGHDGRSLDNHMTVNLDVATNGASSSALLFSSDKGQKAPFLLLLAGFLMFSGALGLSFFGLLELNIYLLLCIAFIPPLLLNKLLGIIWRKITKSEMYLIPAELPLIGQKVRVVMPVDADGGEVRIDASSSPIGSQRLAVMPLYPEKTFGQGEEIYICDYSIVKGVKFYLVDDNPSEIRKTRRVQV